MMLTFSVLLIFLVALISGIVPFYKHYQSKNLPNINSETRAAESLACGVFLGVGLIHMLNRSALGFYQLHFHYPFAFLIAGAMFLGLLWLEHLGQELYGHQKSGEPVPKGFAVLATIMLSVHSFLAGAALGMSGSLSVIIVMLIAIVAHKWAAGLALAIEINKSNLSLKSSISLFLIFVIMTPLGIIFGYKLSHSLSGDANILLPVFSALASGTFIYLGTLHGLSRAVMVKKCCNLKNYSWVLIGFSLMALVAIFC